MSTKKVDRLFVQLFNFLDKQRVRTLYAITVVPMLCVWGYAAFINTGLLYTSAAAYTFVVVASSFLTIKDVLDGNSPEYRKIFFAMHTQSLFLAIWSIISLAMLTLFFLVVIAVLGIIQLF